MMLMVFMALSFNHLERELESFNFACKLGVGHHEGEVFLLLDLRFNLDDLVLKLGSLIGVEAHVVLRE